MHTEFVQHFPFPTGRECGMMQKSLIVGADAHIGPTATTFVNRADVGIGPYV